MSSSEKDHVRPLATAADRTTSSDEENPAKWQSSRRRKFYKRRSVQCCGCCTVMLAIVAVVLLVVGLTVYKVREPKATMNSISIDMKSIDPPNVNMTVTAQVSLKNRNPATFYFDGSLTSLYYNDMLVGKASGPPGRSAGFRTFRMNITVDVVSDQLLSDPNLIGSGALTMNSSTAVGGHVMVFGLFRHHVDLLMNCTVTVAVVNQSILYQFCRQRVWA